MARPPKRLLASPARPTVRSRDRLRRWKATTAPYSGLVQHPIFDDLRIRLACDAFALSTDAGPGLRKFMLFCDIFRIQERERCPASFGLICSFAMWMTLKPEEGEHWGVPTETVGVATAKNYLGNVYTWHTVQGFARPCSPAQEKQIRSLMKGAARTQDPRHTRTKRPPVMLPDLRLLRENLALEDPFDAAVWAASLTAFFGLARLGEVTVRTSGIYNSATHPSRSDFATAIAADGLHFATLRLPWAKTMDVFKREDQWLILAPQAEEFDPLSAVANHLEINNLPPTAHAFAWTDNSGVARPLTRSAMLNRLHRAWHQNPTRLFGHSFRIGGSSFLLARGQTPETVKLVGRWKSLAFHTYLRSIEQALADRLAFLA